MMIITIFDTVVIVMIAIIVIIVIISGARLKLYIPIWRPVCLVSFLVYKNNQSSFPRVLVGGGRAGRDMTV